MYGLISGRWKARRRQSGRGGTTPYRPKCSTVCLVAIAIWPRISLADDTSSIESDRRPIPAICQTEIRSRKSHDADADYAAWDRKLNQTYRLVLGGLHPEDREIAVASEKAWLRFRDAETAAATALLLARLGSSPKSRSAIRTWRLGLVKERVSLLKDYDLTLLLVNHKAGPDTPRPTDYLDAHDTHIDRWLNNALVNIDDAGGGAVETAAQMRDRELNRIYRKIRSGCSEKERQTLAAAETAWLSYRDQEYKLIEKIYLDYGNPELADDDSRGTGIVQVHLIKLRVLQLSRLDAMLNSRAQRCGVNDGVAIQQRAGRDRGF